MTVLQNRHIAGTIVSHSHDTWVHRHSSASYPPGSVGIAALGPQEYLWRSLDITSDPPIESNERSFHVYENTTPNIQ